MLQSKTRWYITFNNLFFKKIIVNRTELRYTRQKIINNCNDFENVKNVRKKIVKIHHIHESQKSVVFYQYEKIQQTSNEMIKNVKIIQIHDLLYIKKNDKTNALNRRNDYIKNKNTINHNIFKINDDKSLLFFIFIIIIYSLSVCNLYRLWH